MKGWKEELDFNGPKELVICLVGNKLDLEGSRAISTEVSFFPPLFSSLSPCVRCADVVE